MCLAGITPWAQLFSIVTFNVGGYVASLLLSSPVKIDDILYNNVLWLKIVTGFIPLVTGYRVIPYQFSKGLDMTSLELDKTWCTSSPGGSILPVED